MAQTVSTYFNINKTTSSTAGSQQQTKPKINLFDFKTTQSVQPTSFSQFVQNKTNKPQNIMNFWPWVSQKWVTNVNEYNPVTKRTENIFTPKPTTTQKSSWFSLIPTANASDEQDLLQQYLQDTKQDNNSKQELFKALQDWTDPNELINYLQTSWYKWTSWQTTTQPQEDQWFFESIKYKPYTQEELTSYDPNKTTTQNILEWQGRYAKNVAWWLYNIIPWVAELWTNLVTWTAKDVWMKVWNLFWLVSDEDRKAYDEAMSDKTWQIVWWVAKDLKQKYIDSSLYWLTKITNSLWLSKQYWDIEYLKNTIMTDPTVIISDVLSVIWVWIAWKSKLTNIQKTALETQKTNIINQVKNATTLEEKSALIKQGIETSKQIAEKTKQVKTLEEAQWIVNKYNPYIQAPILVTKWVINWSQIIKKNIEKNIEKNKETKYNKWVEEIYQAVNPTTRENKAQLRQKVDDLLPYIDEKNMFSNDLEVVKWRVDVDKNKAYSNMKDYEDNVWVKWRVETAPIIKQIEDKFIEKTSDWVIIDEATARIANELISKLKEFWPTLTDWDIIKVRRNWDKIIEKNKWFMQSAEANTKWDLYNEANKFFRNEIRKSNPEYADYLKQYHKTVWLSDILDATIQRRTWQSQWWYLRRTWENIARVAWTWIWASIWWVPWAVVWNLATEWLISWVLKLTGSSAKLAKWKKLILNNKKNGTSNNNIPNNGNTNMVANKEQLTSRPQLKPSILSSREKALITNKSKNKTSNKPIQQTPKTWWELLKPKETEEFNTLWDKLSKAYKESAKKRFAEWDFTQTEIRKGYKKLNSLYEWKKWQLQNGDTFEIVSKPAYWKVKVKMEDWTIKNMYTDDIYRNQKQATLSEVKEYLKWTEYKWFNLKKVLPSNFKEKAQDFIEWVADKVWARTKFIDYWDKLYHWTTAKFDKFSDDFTNKHWFLWQGHYFTPNKDYAKSYWKNIKETFLDEWLKIYNAKANSSWQVYSELKDKFPWLNDFNIRKVLEENWYNWIQYTDWERWDIINIFRSENIPDKLKKSKMWNEWIWADKTALLKGGDDLIKYNWAEYFQRWDKYYKRFKLLEGGNVIEREVINPWVIEELNIFKAKWQKWVDEYKNKLQSDYLKRKEDRLKEKELANNKTIKKLDIKDLTITKTKLPNYTLYHWTSSQNLWKILKEWFKAWNELPENAFRWWWHWAIQNSISFSLDPKISANFTWTWNKWWLITVNINKDANIVKIPQVEWEYAEYLNDIIPDLKKKWIDAVYIWWEDELVVINKNIIKIIWTKEFNVAKANQELKQIYEQSQKPKPLKKTSKN